MEFHEKIETVVPVTYGTMLLMTCIIVWQSFILVACVILRFH